MYFPPFQETELEVIGQLSSAYAHVPPSPRYNTPITLKENTLRLLRGETPCFLPAISDIQSFSPRIFPDNIACGLIKDAEEPLTVKDFGGVGWFDTNWVYVEHVGGATTVPGKPQLPDVNDWETLVKFPDIDSYDWAASAKVNESFLERDRVVYVHMLCAYWERLMALMDVSDAAMAMIDEDCTEAVHGLFTRLTDLYIRVVDLCCEYYHPDMFMWHDDWGTQRAPFFTVDTLNEMIIPHIRRLIDHIHSKGCFFELHSCGMNVTNVPSMIAAGVDMWNPQPMNDKPALAKQYGDRLVISIDAPLTAPDAADGEIEEIAQRFFEEFKDVRFILNDRGIDPRLYKALYRRFRLHYLAREN